MDEETVCNVDQLPDELNKVTTSTNTMYPYTKIQRWMINRAKQPTALEPQTARGPKKPQLHSELILGNLIHYRFRQGMCSTVVIVN